MFSTISKFLTAIGDWIKEYEEDYAKLEGNATYFLQEAQFNGSGVPCTYTLIIPEESRENSMQSNEGMEGK